MSSDRDDARQDFFPIFILTTAEPDAMILRGQVRIRDGEVVLYRRGESTKWQARYKLPDNSWHRVSTKRSNLLEARRIAGEAYDKARFRFADGRVAVSRRFRDVANLTIERLRQARASGQGRTTYIDYIQAIDNYLKPYFGNKHIDKIGQDDIAKFDGWRIKKMEKEPAASTITNHSSALRQVFDTALNEGWIARKNIPVVKNRGKKSQRRPDFTIDEWNKLTANLRHWAKKATEKRSLHMRELLWDYVLVLANTGMRTGTEAQNLRWKQIRWHHQKSGDRYLVIRVKGKTGERELVARHGCEKFFHRIQMRFPDLAAMTFDELIKKKVDEFVFRMRNGKRTKNMPHTFTALLKKFGLLKDSQGNVRTLYSLRHMYATMRLVLDKIPIHSLAKQMGTSVGMLEKHYSHLEPIMQADVFAGKRYKN